MSRRKNTGRTFHLHPVFSSFATCRISVAITAFLQIPAFFSSCEHPLVSEDAPNGPQIYIQWTKNTTPEAIDLFFFDTLGAQKLDSYQQIQRPEGPAHVYGVSGAGAKRMVALSGTAGVTDPWLDINNYGNLCKKTFRLEEENPYAPHLVAEGLLADAASRTYPLNLQPMLSQIRLVSVSCDFSARPYRDPSFHCTKIYLTNVATEYKPLGPGGGHPVSWINAGCLDSVATRALPHPELLLRPGLGRVVLERQFPNLLFSCYANPEGQGDIPRTRLVLEGTVDGILCYYPIEIASLEPAREYQISLTLKRMGSSDPDIPVRSDAVLVETQTVPWQTREPYTVTF
jgi:hypothetical protein